MPVVDAHIPATYNKGPAPPKSKSVLDLLNSSQSSSSSSSSRPSNPIIAPPIYGGKDPRRPPNQSSGGEASSSSNVSLNQDSQTSTDENHEYPTLVRDNSGIYIYIYI